MAHTHALAGSRPSGDDLRKEASADVVTAAHVGHEGGRSGFWRHFAEMIVAMAIGMFVGLAVFLTVIGMTFDEALVRQPTASSDRRGGEHDRADDRLDAPPRPRVEGAVQRWRRRCSFP